VHTPESTALFEPQVRTLVGQSRRWRLAVLGAVVLCEALLIPAPTIASSSHSLQTVYLWGTFGILTVLCLVLILPFFGGRGEKRDSLEPAVGIALVAWVGFGLGAVYSTSTGYGGRAYGHNPVWGLTTATSALLLFVIGYSLSPHRSRPIALPAWKPGRAFAAGLLLIGIGAFGQLESFVHGEYFIFTQRQPLEVINSTYGYLAQLLFVGLGITAIVALGPTGRPWQRWFLAAAVVVLTAVLLPTGNRSELLYVAAAIGIPFHYYYRRVRVVEIVAGLAIFVLVINPVGSLYRGEYGATGYARASSPKQIPSLIYRTAVDIKNLGPIGYVQYAIGDRFARLDMATTLSAMRDVVPSKIPYQRGATFLPIVLSVVPIPRLLWHDKPTFQYDNLFGRMAGYLQPTDYRTTVKINYLGELYLDFGYIGLLVGMFVYGIVFRRVHAMLVIGDQPQSLSVLTYSLVLVPIWTMESALGPALGGIVRELLSALVVLFLFGAIPLPLSNGPIWLFESRLRGIRG
jgi:O-antigen polysaccharide polymerase Wzy-like protein